MFNEAKAFHKVALPIFTIICLLFFAFNASAFDVPKDAVIKVFTKDGKQIGEMSRETHKVVKLNTSAPTKVVQITKTKTVYMKAQCKNNNRLTVKGGVGYDGLTVKSNGQYHEVTESRQAVFGLGYSRKITPNISIGGSYINNDTATLDLGFDF